MRRLELNITILSNAAIHIFNVIILVYVIYIRILDLLLIIQRYRYLHCSTWLNLFAVYQPEGTRYSLLDEKADLQ